MVMIFRGKGQLLLGDEIHDVESGDFIEFQARQFISSALIKGTILVSYVW